MKYIEPEMEIIQFTWDEVFTNDTLHGSDPSDGVIENNTGIPEDKWL